MTDRSYEFNNISYNTPAILKEREDHHLNPTNLASTYGSTPVAKGTTYTNHTHQSHKSSSVLKFGSDELCEYPDCTGIAEFKCKFNYSSDISGCKRKVCKKHIVSNLNWICNDCDKRVFKKGLCFTVKWCAIMTAVLVITYIILIIGIKQLMFW